MPPDPLTRTVQAVLAGLPCSERALARTAGLSSAMLPRIRAGHFAATPETVGRLITALDQWSHDCASAAERLRRASTRPRRPT